MELVVTYVEKLERTQQITLSRALVVVMTRWRIFGLLTLAAILLVAQ